METWTFYPPLIKVTFVLQGFDSEFCSVFNCFHLCKRQYPFFKTGIAVARLPSFLHVISFWLNDWPIGVRAGSCCISNLIRSLPVHAVILPRVFFLRGLCINFFDVLKIGPHDHLDPWLTDGSSKYVLAVLCFVTGPAHTCNGFDKKKVQIAEHHCQVNIYITFTYLLYLTVRSYVCYITIYHCLLHMLRFTKSTFNKLDWSRSRASPRDSPFPIASRSGAAHGAPGRSAARHDDLCLDEKTRKICCFEFLYRCRFDSLATIYIYI